MSINRERTQRATNQAMWNLSLPQYSGIMDLFGNVLARRAKQRDSDCALFNLLARKVPLLQAINGDCSLYVRAIGLVDGRRKCEADLRGNVTRPAEGPSGFNGACGDVLAEIAAIRMLAGRAYDRFRALSTGTDKTSDYEVYFRDDRACIEVKNMRPTETVLNLFDQAIREAYKAEPAQFAFNIAVEYPFDTRPTGQQMSAVKQCVASMRGRTPPFIEPLDLQDAIVQITVVKGYGTACMTRRLTLDSPESLDKQRFLNKVRDKALEAMGQMRDDTCLKVLVLNYNSPSGSFPSDFHDDAIVIIRAVFRGLVDPYVLFYGNLLI
jgi:hypothetical protein